MRGWQGKTRLNANPTPVQLCTSGPHAKCCHANVLLEQRQHSITKERVHSNASAFIPPFLPPTMHSVLPVSPSSWGRWEGCGGRARRRHWGRFVTPGVFSCDISMLCAEQTWLSAAGRRLYHSRKRL